MKVYTILIPNLTNRYLHPIRFRRAIQFIESLPGLRCVYDNFPKGFVLGFATTTHAKKAQLKILETRNAVSPEIVEADMADDMSVLKINKVVDYLPGYTNEGGEDDGVHLLQREGTEHSC